MSQPNTLVISPYPLGGNDPNTKPRYDEEERITGYRINGITRTGSDTLHFSPRLRHVLSTPALFDEFCAEEAASLQSRTEYYANVIVRGQSTGSFPALGMVKGGLRTTHLLLEDGINTMVRPDGSIKGPIDSRHDWYTYGKLEKAGMPQPPQEGWVAPPKLPLTKVEMLAGAAKFIIEQAHWAPLWRSDYSRVTALELVATRPELPILFKFLGHTGASTPETVAQFQADLEQAQAKRADTGLSHAGVRADYDPDGWHGYLVYPQYGAANLQQVAQMESLVA